MYLQADVFSFGVILCQMIARIDADPECGLYRTPKFGLDYVRYSVLCPRDTPTDLLNLAFKCCVVRLLSSVTQLYDMENVKCADESPDSSVVPGNRAAGDGHRRAVRHSAAPSTIDAHRRQQSERSLRYA